MLLPTPLPPGVTAVSAVHFYDDEAHDGEPVVAPVALVDGSLHVDTLNVPRGRWYGLVQAQQAADAYVYPLLDPVDLPEDPRLVVSVEEVAVDAGMALPLTDQQRATILAAIRQAQSDVVAYLGRPITPQTYVETDRWGYADGWDLKAAPDEDVVEYVSVVAQVDANSQPTNYFTVTYRAGIDAKHGAEYEPIREFVKVHAQSKPSFLRMWRTATNAQGEVRSVSAEGQSVSFTPASLSTGGGKAGEAGSTANIGSLDRWRLAGRRVYQAPTRATQFPYEGMGALP